MNQTALSQALNHGIKVAAWVIGSAVLPALISFYSQNIYWLALTPIINALGAGLIRWSGIVAAQKAAASPHQSKSTPII
jgi:hypothetical protein